MRSQQEVARGGERERPSAASDDGASGGGDVLKLDRRKALITIGIAVALAAGAVALIGKAANYGQLAHALVGMDKRWIPLLVLGELLAYAGYIFAYRDLARVCGGPVLRYWTIVRIVAIGFGAFVIGSSAGGLAVDYWALRRSGVRSHGAARRVLALNTLEWAWLGAFATASAVVVLAIRGSAAPVGMTIAWIVVVPLCVLAAAWVSAPGRADRLSALPEDDAKERPDEGRVRRWSRWLAKKARTGLADAIGGLVFVRQVLSHPLRYRAGFFGYPIYWTGDLVTLYFALRAFDAHIGIAALVLAYTTAYVVTALPLPAGGAGGVDAALALSLHVVGVPLVAALLAAAVYRIFAFWLPILPALALVGTVGSLREDLRQEGLS